MNATSEAATVVRSLFEAMEARDWALARTLISDDATIDWTETGERFVGQRFIDVNEAYPEGWTIDVVEVLDAGDRAAAQVRVTLGDETFWCAGFYSVHDGRITGGTEHWVTAGSEAPPVWREGFAEG